ncbi:hypothetical protein TBLA_0A07190 [Henningerozyma blattae CBS 6284]|uniref:ABC transporter domain-containing protein n=1 Tax=Henningerozyma blattae (strain ATCC 34711 / CBS 6284 / DSM 70876 / NBRC 10599 / NRRL Y-10934 / UCD 77-7) TaxID=1071380 RepID=I2GWK7_HENB6|nr:hypothetical protein TBLA_0A07190 [Tetrapisispora blattae CBS 6284]CCH58509.1 hypothetical protein TBLA_0A07190 [Tetrapisispora blattae CBS 6284]
MLRFRTTCLPIKNTLSPTNLLFPSVFKSSSNYKSIAKLPYTRLYQTNVSNISLKLPISIPLRFQQLTYPFLGSKRCYSTEGNNSNNNNNDSTSPLNINESSLNKKKLEEPLNEELTDKINPSSIRSPPPNKTNYSPRAEDEKKGRSELARLVLMTLRDWKLLLLAITLLTISCSIGMAIPKVIGLVLDALKNVMTDSPSSLETSDLPPIAFGLTLYPFLGAFAGALVIGTMCNYGRYILLRLLSERVVARLRSHVIKKTLHQDAEFFDQNKVGDLISRLGSDAYVVSRSLTQKVSDGFKAILCGGAGIGMMISISPQLSSFLVIFAPAVVISASIFGKKIRDISTILQEATGQLTRVSEEQLNGVKTVQSFVAEQKEIRRYNNAIRDIYNIGKMSAVVNSKFSTSTSVIGDMSFLVVLAYGSYLVLHGSLTIGDLTAFMLYTDYTANSIFGLSNFYSEIMQGVGAAKRLFDLTDRIPAIRPTIGEKFIPGDGCIEFRNLGFAYPTRPENQVFKNLNFKIEPGTSVCIVGPSGRGKSTIALLLLRYYNPSSGQILIDNQDIMKLNPKSLRQYMGIVQQEPVLMSGSIRDNITYGLKREATPDEIREVSKQCFCHNFITKFPDAYETIIGPHGTLLSGGQKQRIAIARALIKKPKILILDEATSALDVESEGAINYTFGKLMKSKSVTIVSIAHRLSTIRRSEYIIVLGNDGSVVETGKFKELYADPTSELSKLLNEKQSRANKKEAPLPPQSDGENGDDFEGNGTPASPPSLHNNLVTDVLKEVSDDSSPLKIAP